MSSVPVTLKATDFPTIKAFASDDEQTDRAELIGTTGAETFYGHGDIGRLTGTGFDNLARYFDQIYADAGDDTPGNDTLNLDSVLYTFLENEENEW